MEEEVICRFKVDRDLCIAVSACIVAEPDIYLLDDDAKAVIKELNLEDIKEISRTSDTDSWVTVKCTDAGYYRIIESARTCPVLAIIVEKKDGDNWITTYPD